MIDLARPRTASTLVEELVAGVGPGRASVYAGAAASPRWLMKALGALTRWLPAPKVPAGTRPLTAPRASSDLNPNGEQIEALLRRPGREPLMVVNLNLHKDEGVDPDTGMQASGHEIANKYFRRGIPTFTRLGAAPVWAGRCRGAVVDGLGLGDFDQIGLIQYPSSEDFATLLQIGDVEGWGQYREAGLDRSWVVHGHVEASR
jgi:hypothetical protein